MLALAAGFGGRAAAPVGSNAIQAFRDQSGGRSFPNSSDAGQNECMGDSTQTANQLNGMEPGNEARDVCNIQFLSSLKHSLLISF